jgi:hypothetical protein
VAQLLPAFEPMQVPLAPQCWRLLAGSMQVPLHWICPPWQESWHAPLEQTSPERQTRPAFAVQSPRAPQN